MGRPIQLMHLDPQDARYQECTGRLLQKEHVDVSIDGTAVASRETIKPIANPTDALFLH